MTLPFAVPPLAWPLVLPAIAVGLWAYTRPASHFIKRLAWTMLRSKVAPYRRLLGQRVGFNAMRTAQSARALFWLLMLPLITLALVSLLVCIGLLNNPPIPGKSPSHFDSSRFELVTEGQTIYARPRKPPSQGLGSNHDQEDR
jgi:hypothetical protein